MSRFHRSTLNRAQCIGALLFCVLLPSSWGAKIALDVGHNLTATGTTSAFGETEFSYNLAIVEVVAKRLREAGHQVTVIGADGQMLDLKPRANAAIGHDLFISFHHDSAREEYLDEWIWKDQPYKITRQFQGYSLFVFSADPQYANTTTAMSPSNPLAGVGAQWKTSLACASRLGNELLKAGLKPTLHHAHGVAGENRVVLDESRGIYEANFAVLRHNSVPAILFEGGVLPNPEEALRLKEPAHRAKVANAVLKSLDCLPPVAVLSKK
ncbi:N-acetylmuramoyl-L-alanine amidase [Chitinibacter bivalviorum]|uniref:N-acetylmuramoyl-L-alanine amidase n=1 Tax=Chitinibacter bivalviorum TaxID=2739434 RepID=A0A7H9BGN2_9NEIS|nr:N-acetylmuramoyl-L-alanine amidase [Chitinibacter bivalviorum]QLG87101.1 N-acetylmuramoyl-L-alanine amidase [Chitinibacter bivalviorum]